jgi:hypothetical protein
MKAQSGGVLGTFPFHLEKSTGAIHTTATVTNCFLIAAVSLSDVLTAFFASFGGLVVLVGLGLEKIYEETKHPDSGAARRYYARRKLGFTLLMVGIGLEVLIAFVHALAGARDLRNVKSIAEANDPRDLRVSEISAKASLEVAGPLDDNIPTQYSGFDFESPVWLMESNGPPYTLSFGAFRPLYVTGAVRTHETTSNGPKTHGYSMNLIRDLGAPGEVMLVPAWTPATTRIVLNRVNWMQFRLAFVPPKSEVLGGSVELLINGTFKKQFGIPHQFCSTNGTFYATNSP